MRDTVYTLSELADEAAIAASVEQMAAAVQSYVPGYRLKQQVQFDRIDTPIRIPGVGNALTGLKTSIFLEVEGAAHYLPAYAGNLDIMTSAGCALPSTWPSACWRRSPWPPEETTHHDANQENLHLRRDPARRQPRHSSPVQRGAGQADRPGPG
jgi:hypothetical protein